MPSFADIENKTVEDVKAPPAFPRGHYLAAVDGMGVWGKSRNAGTKQIQFKAKLLQPMDDVDKDALMAWKDETGDSVLGQSVYIVFYDPRPHLLTEFLAHLGLGKLQTKEAIAEAPGKQFIVEIGHTPSQDGKRIVHEIKGTAAV